MSKSMKTFSLYEQGRTRPAVRGGDAITRLEWANQDVQHSPQRGKMLLTNSDIDESFQRIHQYLPVINAMCVSHHKVLT